MTQNTIDLNEIKKFSALADKWWDPEGEFKILHRFNPVRLDYVASKISDLKNTPNENNLNNLNILDVGCGGGLIAENLFFRKANVTAIDPAEKNILTAKAHQLESKSLVNYIISDISNLDKSKKFDIITCLEVIEHVVNPQSFIKQLTEHLKPNGLLFIATINRTVKSLLLAKYTAEYILNWLPHGTHDWQRFLKPSEIVNFLDDVVIELDEIKGFSYNILTRKWLLSNDISQNYIICFKNHLQK